MQRGGGGVWDYVWSRCPNVAAAQRGGGVAILLPQYSTMDAAAAAATYLTHL